MKKQTSQVEEDLSRRILAGTCEVKRTCEVFPGLPQVIQEEKHLQIMTIATEAGLTLQDNVDKITPI